MIKIGKYLIVSVFVTALDLTVLPLLVEVFSVHYIYAATTSYIIGVLSKFALNKTWVFKDAPGVWLSQLGRFAVVSLSGLVLTNVVMWVGVEFLIIHYFLVKAAAVGIVFLWTYVLHNTYSFRSDTVDLSTIVSEENHEPNTRALTPESGEYGKWL